MKKEAKKPHVLIATGLYSPEIGGPATYTRILEEELPKRGITLTVVPFRAVRFLPRILRHIVYFFYILAKAIPADTIYALDPVSVGFPSAITARMLNKRFLLRIAGDYAWEQGTARYGVSESLDTFSKKGTDYPFFVNLLKRIQTFTARDADLVIVPSQYLRQVVMHWGIDSEQVQVIYNAFSAPDGLASREVLRQMMHLKGDVIMSAGRLVPWKGFDLLIEIMSDIIKDQPNAKLFIAGSGQEEQQLQDIITKKGLDKSVVLTGELDKTTLHNYIKAADVFVLNTFYEGLSHQLLECMAVGTPVVSTFVGGNPEIIEDGKTGYLVEYNDKTALIKRILKLLKDKDAAQYITSNACDFVKSFSKERMINELVKVLK